MLKIMAKAHLKLVTPATEKRTVTPKRLPNGKLRTREYLTEAEIERLMAAGETLRLSLICNRGPSPQYPPRESFCVRN